MRLPDRASPSADTPGSFPGRDTRTPRIRARGLTKSYGETRALDAAGLDVFDGEAVAIMGPSGSGKSTLLHVLAGVLAPEDGQVLLRTASDEVDVAGLGERARSALRLAQFGFVFQQGLLIPELTAQENVALPLLLAGEGRAAAGARASAALQDLGLSGMEGRRPGQLSGGQAQRVAIARATVTEAPVVFADEPTGSLDSHTAMDVMDALLEATVGAAGRCLVVVTHDDDVAAKCSRVVRVLDGRTTDEGSPR